jgi:hypothetical protein
MANECVTNYFEIRIFRFFRNDYDELKDSRVSNIMHAGVLETRHYYRHRGATAQQRLTMETSARTDRLRLTTPLCAPAPQQPLFHTGHGVSTEQIPGSEVTRATEARRVPNE